jgi:hypothetical protein
MDPMMCDEANTNDEYEPDPSFRKFSQERADLYFSELRVLANAGEKQRLQERLRLVQSDGLPSFEAFCFGIRLLAQEQDPSLQWTLGYFLWGVATGAREELSLLLPFVLHEHHGVRRYIFELLTWYQGAIPAEHYATIARLSAIEPDADY